MEKFIRLLFSAALVIGVLAGSLMLASIVVNAQGLGKAYSNNGLSFRASYGAAMNNTPPALVLNYIIKT